MSKITSLLSVFIIAWLSCESVSISKSPCFAREALEELKYKELYAHSYDCEFADSLNGWLGGKAGILFATKDGGKPSVSDLHN